MLLLRELLLMPLLTMAGIYDLREKKIPNYLIWSGWIFALSIRFLQEGLRGLIYCMAAILVTVTIAFPLFWIRAVGAGDVKLVSVIGGMYGLEFLYLVTVVWLIMAGFVSLAILFRNRIFLDRFQYMWFYFTAGREKGVPYYDKNRDSPESTVILAPILAAAYVLVLLGKWGKVC